MLTVCVRFVAKPATQELASTATLEPIHNNNADIIEIDESTTTCRVYSLQILERLQLFNAIVKALLTPIAC